MRYREIKRGGTLHYWISPIAGAFIKWGRGGWIDGCMEKENKRVEREVVGNQIK